MSVDTSLADLSAYDVAVIGGSAAGLSAALVLSRARRKVLVVDSGQPRNAPADQMHGYLSRDGLAPTELLAIGREEVKGYGGEVLQGTVAELAPNGRSGFRVRLTDGRRVSARRLLVATVCLPKIHPRRSHGVSVLGRDCRCQKPTVVL
jgi:thioredoxin reductase